MEKTFVNLDTFKKTIDGFDQSLLGFWTDLESLLAKRDAELQQASKDSNAYLKKIIDDKHVKNTFKLCLMQVAPQYGYPETLKYD